MTYEGSQLSSRRYLFTMMELLRSLTLRAVHLVHSYLTLQKPNHHRRLPWLDEEYEFFIGKFFAPTQ